MRFAESNYRKGLESEKLPEAIYTPSTKAEIGDHDENISYERALKFWRKHTQEELKRLAQKAKELTLAVYKCADYALERYNNRGY